MGHAVLNGKRKICEKFCGKFLRRDATWEN
jgi:hypothetical protein